MPDPAEREAQIEKILVEWNAEKEALAKEKEDLMQTCKELQDKIKEIKEGGAKWRYHNRSFVLL